MNDEQVPVVQIKEDRLREMVEYIDSIKKLTHTTDMQTAWNRLTWIDDMVKRRAERMKIFYRGGPGETLESIFHEYDKRSLEFEEYRKETLSLLEAIELILMHGIIPEDDPESERIRVVHYTVAGALKALKEWRPDGHIPF